jgi:hypothetical protein
LPEEIVKNLLRIKSGLQVAFKLYDEAYLSAKAQADADKPGDKKTFAILVTRTRICGQRHSSRCSMERLPT